MTPARLALSGATLIAGLAAVFLPVIWTIDPSRMLSGRFVTEQFLSVLLAVTASFIFLSEAGRRTSRLQSGVLICAALAAIGAGIGLFAHFGSDAALFVRPTPRIMALSLSVILCVAWAVSIAAGRPMLVLVLVALLLGYSAQYFGPPFDAAPIKPDRYIAYMAVGGDAFLGQALKVIGTTVTLFIFFGAAFEAAGGAAAIDALALRLAQGGSGAAIKATILSSAIFGTVSGSATSNVLTSGNITIQGMKKMGVPAPQAGGIEALSSTLGQLTPPVMGAAAFIMADISGIPYGTIALSAAVPAAICYILMMQQATRYGRRVEKRRNAPVGPDAAAVEPLRYSMLWHIAPFAAITYTITAGEFATALAGVMGAATSAAVGVMLLGPKTYALRLWAVGRRTATTMAMLVLSGSGLGAIIGALNLTGLDVSLTLAISRLGEAYLFASLCLTALAALVLGAGLSTSGVYIVVATLLAPGMISAGVQPIAAHMFVLYFGVVSMITPPVAFAALAASGISGARFTETALAAMRFGWFMFVVPFLFVYFPGLLLAGEPGDIALTLGAAAVVLGVAGWYSRYPPGRRRMEARRAVPD